MAEEVAPVNPDLVIRDKEGKPYSVRYDQVNAMLLNEFLKEHRAFVEGQLKVANQQKEIDALKEELKEQRYLIQKVSDKVELSQSRPEWPDANPESREAHGRVGLRALHNGLQRRRGQCTLQHGLIIH